MAKRRTRGPGPKERAVLEMTPAQIDVAFKIHDAGRTDGIPRDHVLDVDDLMRRSRLGYGFCVRTQEQDDEDPFSGRRLETD